MRYSLFSLTFKSTLNFPRTSLLPGLLVSCQVCLFTGFPERYTGRTYPARSIGFTDGLVSRAWVTLQNASFCHLPTPSPGSAFPSTLCLTYGRQQATSVSGVDPAPEGSSQTQGHRFCRIWDRTFSLLLPEESFKHTVHISYDCDLLL